MDVNEKIHLIFLIAVNCRSGTLENFSPTGENWFWFGLVCKQIKLICLFISFFEEQLTFWKCK